MSKLTNALDFPVDGTRAIKLVDANPRRKVLNIWAGSENLWYGNRNVKPDTVGNKVQGNGRVEIKDTKAEVWVIRTNGAPLVPCSVSEEVEG